MPFISNYGLFWKSEDVYWGAGGNRGALYGVPANNVSGSAIDFRDQRGVYVLYSDYQIIYVGQNAEQELIARLKQHKKDDLADRWDRFSWYGVRAVNQDGNLKKYNQSVNVNMPLALNHIEAVLIHAAEPPLNRQGGRFGEDVRQYLQFRDERLGPSLEDMVKDIHDRQERL